MHFSFGVHYFFGGGIARRGAENAEENNKKLRNVNVLFFWRNGTQRRRERKERNIELKEMETSHTYLHNGLIVFEF